MKYPVRVKCQSCGKTYIVYINEVPYCDDCLAIVESIRRLKNKLDDNLYDSF